MLRHERKLQSYEKLILAISDQQLVTGIALLLSTNIICIQNTLRKSWSVYSYRIAVSSAFFASITHLSCVSVLREYFIKHKTLRTIRVWAMLLFLLMLAVNIIIAQSGTFLYFPEASVACAFRQFSFIDDKRFLAGLLNQIIIFSMLVGGYAKRIEELYEVHSVATLFLAKLFSKYVSIVSPEPGNSEPLPTTELNRFLMAAAVISDSRKSANPLCSGTALFIMHNELSHSFLWEILWLIFYFTFGLGQFVIFFEYGEYRTFEPNFGQLMPMVLLFLPVLSTFETASGKCTSARGKDKCLIEATDLKDAEELQSRSNDAQEPSGSSGSSDHIQSRSDDENRDLDSVSRRDGSIARILDHNDIEMVAAQAIATTAHS